MSPRFPALAVVLAICLLSPAAVRSAPPQRSFDRQSAHQELVAEMLEDELVLCGTAADELPSARQLRAVSKGTPVFFFQDPPVFNYDYRGEVTLREVTVVGDIPTITFNPAIADTNQRHPDETWRRVGTDTIEGVKVSLFERTFTAQEMDLFFNFRRTGFDRPDLFIGALEPDVQARDGSQAKNRFGISLRVAPTAMKTVTVTRLNSRVSYSSDVVNIVLRGYGNGRVTDNGFSIQDRELAQVFYDHFEDSTQFLAIVPRWPTLSSQFGAFHRRTNQVIEGIGTPLQERNDEYGDPDLLMGLDFFRDRGLGRNKNWSHELAHQWGHYFDWTALAGLVPGGHQPSFHLPLATGGTTFIGAVLRAGREVTRSARLGGRAAFQIGVPQPVSTFHPWVQYAMGLLPADELPRLRVFEDQRQFDPIESSSPAVGTPVTGGSIAVGIDEIVAVHGARSGPKIRRQLKRTVVIVSRQERLTQEEFDYWTWISQRHTYAKNDDGVTSLDGYASFFQSTGGKAKLVNVVDPKEGPKLVGKLRIGYPGVQPGDWRAVRLNQRLPTRIRPGQQLDFSGQVVATDRDDFNRVLIRIRRYDPASNASFEASVGTAAGPALWRRAEDIELRSGLDADQRFNLQYTFSEGEVGRYSVEVFVFWPKSGKQFSRDFRTPFHVQ